MSQRLIKIDPTLNVHTTLAKAQRLADKAAKKGLAGGYTVTTETRLETNADGSVYEVNYLVIDGEPAKFNGWTFVALVEWVGDNPVVTGSPTYDGQPVDRDALVKGACDHCGYNRSRKAVVIVENEAGERKQVGKQCVKDYLGNALAVSWFSTKDVFEEFDGYTGYGTKFEWVPQVLAAAASVVRQRGWVSKANASENDKTSTAEFVRLFLRGSEPSNYYELQDYRALHAGWDETVDVPAGRAALEYGRALEANSEWASNLKAVIAEDYFDPKYFNLVVSLAGVHANALRKQAEEQAEDIADAPYGQVGDKVTLTLNTVSCHAFYTQFGTSFANVFTGEGYRFKWLTSARDFDKGETVTLKGTIKKHEEYKGKTYTVLTRCKVLSDAVAVDSDL
jgi:hypothetical protein